MVWLQQLSVYCKWLLIKTDTGFRLCKFIYISSMKYSTSVSPAGCSLPLCCNTWSFSVVLCLLWFFWMLCEIICGLYRSPLRPSATARALNPSLDFILNAKVRNCMCVCDSRPLCACIWVCWHRKKAVLFYKIKLKKCSGSVIKRLWAAWGKQEKLTNLTFGASPWALHKRSSVWIWMTGKYCTRSSTKVGWKYSPKSCS